MNIVLLLCGFRTTMSFTGSVGAIMNGSGLQNAFETIFGENPVKHLLIGKTISKATRSNFLGMGKLAPHNGPA